MNLRSGDKLFRTDSCESNFRDDRYKWYFGYLWYFFGGTCGTSGTSGTTDSSNCFARGANQNAGWRSSPISVV